MTSPLTLMPLLLLGALAHQGSDWSYSDGALNEVHWSKAYPTCGGKRQSPIDVQRKKVRYNPSLQALKMTGYEAHEGEFTITNTGHTVQISLPSTMRLTTNGTEYRAVQMHFHWNGAPFKFSGSEHTIDGIRYATEIHVVHYNSKYGTYERAKDAPDGLAVLAALVEVKDYVENTYYSNFISHLENVRYAGQSTVLSGLNIQNMLPQDLQHYYSYQGSLTTPPCTENVQWFLLAGFVPLSKAQIWTLENSLLGQRNHTIHDNYRTTQPRNDRVVEANFMPHPNHRSELQNYLHRIKSNLDFLRKYIEEKKVEEKYVNELAV